MADLQLILAKPNDAQLIHTMKYDAFLPLYQRYRDEETNPVLVYHGLNGVYISELDKWIRLDASGNMGDINAQFSVEKEQLAFKIRPELGEIDNFTVYSKPDTNIIKKLRNNKTRTKLLEDLPTELEDEKHIELTKLNL